MPAFCAAHLPLEGSPFTLPVRVAVPPATPSNGLSIILFPPRPPDSLYSRRSRGATGFVTIADSSSAAPNSPSRALRRPMTDVPRSVLVAEARQQQTGARRSQLARVLVDLSESLRSSIPLQKQQLLHDRQQLLVGELRQTRRGKWEQSGGCHRDQRCAADQVDRKLPSSIILL